MRLQVAVWQVLGSESFMQWSAFVKFPFEFIIHFINSHWCFHSSPRSFRSTALAHKCLVSCTVNRIDRPGEQWVPWRFAGIHSKLIWNLKISSHLQSLKVSWQLLCMSSIWHSEVIVKKKKKKHYQKQGPLEGCLKSINGAEPRAEGKWKAVIQFDMKGLYFTFSISIFGTLHGLK